MHELIKKIIILSFFILPSISISDNDKINRIEVLVNEQIITKHDIIQRIKLNSILNRVEINESNYNQLLNAVIDDLVTEKLKNSKTEEYNIDFNKDEFRDYEKRFYSNIGYEKSELMKLFDLNDINYKYLIDYIEIDLKWQKLIYGLYLRIISVTDQEIIDLINKNPDISEDIASEIILQKQLDIKSKKLIKDLRDEATIEYK